MDSFAPEADSQQSETQVVLKALHEAVCSLYGAQIQCQEATGAVAWVRQPEEELVLRVAGQPWVYHLVS